MGLGSEGELAHVPRMKATVGTERVDLCRTMRPRVETSVSCRQKKPGVLLRQGTLVPGHKQGTRDVAPWESRQLSGGSTPLHSVLIGPTSAA